MRSKSLYQRLAAFLFVSLISSYAQVQALDPSKSLSQYIHDVWQTEEGLPHESIAAIIQTRDGYIWLGTGGGLARFDGVHFTVFNKMNTREIRNNEITALFEDSQGIIWIGTGGAGLISLKDGKFKAFTTEDGLPHDYVMAIFEDNKGNLWIGTEGGLSKMREGRFINYTSKNGLPRDNVRSIYADREGGVWAGTYGGGLALIKEEKIVVYTAKEGLANNFILTVCGDSEGNLWVGTVGGLSLFKKGKFITYSTRDGLSHDTIRTIFEDRNGCLWFGTYGGGLNRLKDGKFTAYTTRDGLSHDSVRIIYEDRDGSLWIGTYGGGLNRLKDGKFTTYTAREGLSNDYTISIWEDRKGSLWIATGGGGLDCLKDCKFISYTKKDGLTNNLIMAVLEDKQGRLWVGTGGGGLNCLKNGKFTAYTVKDGLSNNFIRAIYESRDGSLWIGTHGGGLNRLKAGKFTTYATKEGLSNDLVMSICEDREGSLWIATGGGGLNRLKDGKFTAYTVKDGLSNNFVRAIYESRDGSLWIGTHGGGLNRLKAGQFTTYTIKDGLSDDTIYQIIEDNKGNLWVGCSKGIFRVRIKELHDFAAGKIGSVTCTSYDKRDGMRSSECASGIQPSACKSRDGRLWFPTLKGVAVIDPENIKFDSKPPSVIIEEVIVNDETLELDQNHRLPPGKKNIEFHYTALSFLVPEKVNFKYMLEEFDKQWIEAGTRRTAYYTNIPPGKYRFKVIACNHDGVWNTSGASFQFNLKPYFYQTWLFYLIGAIAFVFSLLGLYRFRVGQLKRHKAELEKRVRERTVELSAANKELQQEIRERKKVEQDISRLKEFNEGIVQNMAEGIIVQDEELNIGFVNPATANLLGYEPEELVGQDWKFIIPPDQHPTIEAADKLRKSTQGSRYEVELLGKGGKRVPVLVSGSPIFNDSRFAGTIAVFTDITELKLAEREIERRQIYLESVLNSAPNAVVTLDAQQRIVEWNPGAEQIFGYSRGEALDKNIDDLVAREEIKGKAEALTRQVLSGKKLLPLETVRYRKDGSPVDVAVAGSPIQIGSEMKGVVAIYTDITGRKQAEKKLQIEKAHVDELFESAQEAIVMADNDGRIIRVNNEFLKLFGYSHEEVINRHIDELVAAKGNRKKAKALTRKAASGRKIALETVRCRKDGKPIHVSLLASPIIVDSKQLAVYGIYRDITEQKKAAEKIKKAMEELGRSNAELENFAYVVSHDLKAPLRAINQLASWLSEDYKDAFDESGREQMNLLMGRVRRLDGLIDGILQYSRAGRLKGKEEALDLNIVVREVVDSLLPPENIKVIIENGLPVVVANRVQMVQVFQNLMGNAIKYMDKPKGEVRVGCEDGGDYWKFSVKDNGPGIEERCYEKIYQIFQTLESRDKRESTGIGLAVVKKIVESLGGKAWVESEVGKGSAFFFTLKKRGDGDEK